MQTWLTVLASVFLLGSVLIFAVFAMAPNSTLVYRQFLLTGFVGALFVSLVCIAWLLRGLLRPYSQLVGEAKRAPVQHSGKSQNEAAFVLETFQSIIAQLQTQQQELERLTAQASRRADSAERFSERIVASMPTGMIAFDQKGQATVINAPARALFQDESHKEGEHFRAVFSDYPALAEMVEACLSGGRLYRREEIEGVNGAAALKRLGATIAPIDPASDSGARGALCLITDITEVSRLREQVALKRNLESLGEMSAGLAHEFKNAMAALHGYAQFLQSVDHDQQGKAAAEALLQEVRNLSDMTTSFLNFARPQPLQLEEVSLDELIDDCARELAPLFETRRVDLVVEGLSSTPAGERGSSPTRGPQTGSPAGVGAVREGAESEPGADRGPRAGSPRGVVDATGSISKRVDSPTVSATTEPGPQIQADARMLRQAFLNLIRNAAEAIPNDPPNDPPNAASAQTDRRVVIRSSIERGADGQQWAAISIQDTGQGIRPADLQKIFIPFFTTKSEGHGVGLALAHRVISEHGGALTVENAAEGGALFTIRLPK